jgi:outer membrane receptor protein involved in Fe transport
VEVGAYQRLPLGGAGRYAELSASWYLQDLDDEIDFDVRTYRYGNIVRSRHTGVEASLRVVLSSRLSLEHAATVSRATFRSSENRGNQLKNIPETSFVTSLHAGVVPSLGVTLTHRARGRVFLDDGNRQELGGVGLVDLGLRWQARGVDVAMSATNLLDSEYGSFGFLLFDPIRGRDVRMVHPGGGRSIGVEVSVAAR